MRVDGHSLPTLAALSALVLLACTPEEGGDEGQDDTSTETGTATGGEDPFTPIMLNDNGAWSWFMDDRAVIYAGKLVVGSVRSLGDFDANKGLEGWGNVEVATLDLDTLAVETAVLHPQFEQDDHNNPAFLPLSEDEGGGLLAVYAKHNTD